MLTLNEILMQLPPLLKKEGYKKQRLNWFRKDEDITLLFTIQKSYYSSEKWYYCFGVAINDLHPEGVRSAHYGDILERYECTVENKMLNTEDILCILKLWEQRFGTIDNLKDVVLKEKRGIRSKENARLFVTIAAKSYFCP